MKSIKLKDIFPNLDPIQYKVHFAKRAPDGTEPLEVYRKGLDEWEKWNSYSNGKNWFNRDYVFSLINFYPEEDTWLFGGVWELVSTDWRKSYPYEIKLVKQFIPFIGRLKIKYRYKERATRVNLDKYYNGMVVKEILEEPYYIDSFPGYENIDIPFETLESIYKNGDNEWRTALSIKGIYLITDTRTGKRYVGKADSDGGIWRRWRHYIRNGHGGDVDLERLVNAKGLDYVKKYFKFSLLETMTGEDEQRINERESHWKRVLLSRKEKFGHNRN